MRRLTDAQDRVVRLIAQGCTFDRGAGSAVLVNGMRVCNTDTMMSLQRAGIVSKDERGCWAATPSGREYAKQRGPFSP